MIILFVAVSWSFQQWIPPSKAFAAPWSPVHGSYAQRKQLTLVNNSGQTFESGTTYKVTIDTQALYNTGSLLSSCDDLRVVYQPSNTTAVELKRAVEYASGSSGVTTCGTSSATKVVFQLQANITNAGTDANYYLYYDNATATTYPSADALAAYNVGSKTATFVAPFNGTTQALAAGNGTPTTATGAIRYSGGKSAMSFDGGDYVTGSLTSSAGNPFTMEMWVKPSSAYKTIWSEVMNFGYGNIHALTKGEGIQQYEIADLTCGSQYMRIGYINWDHWEHIAFTYDGTYIRGFVNGVLYGGSVNCPNLPLSGYNLGRGNGARPYMGEIDEVRVSNSVRYTSNFTPSTTPFVRDEYTKLLLHFDESGDDPRNTGKAIDDSGNGNHGTITGAKYVGGLVGVDQSVIPTAAEGSLSSGSYASHNGVFIEEGTTNKITNPSFEHATYDTNWSSNGNWWEAGGSTGVVAAYQPIGATDLANSYINKANPGTYNAAPGVAPTFNAVTGWTFDGSKWLSTGYTISSVNNLSFIGRFSDVTADGFMMGITNGGGSYITVAPRVIPTLRQYWNWSGGMANGAGAITNGTIGKAGSSFYLNGIYDTSLPPPADANPNIIFIVGAMDPYGWSTRFTGKIQATAIYNTALTANQVLAVTNSMNTLGLTVSKNTSAPYYKFGLSSTKVIASADGSITTIVNAGNTNTHTLSAYVYDGTSGNVGGTVSSSIAQLVFNGSAQTTTYTDMGGGWWRLSYSGSGIASSQSFGIQVKSGKTIYMDGVQLEEKAYATTYTDGTMGTGYAWTGTANDSTSTRSAETIGYSGTSNFSNTSGSVSFWAKPNENWSTNNGNRRFFDFRTNGVSSYSTLWRNGTSFTHWDAANQVGFGSASLSGTTWAHITLSWTSGGNRILYVNGTQLGNSYSYSGGNAASIYVGSDGPSSYIDGSISDFRILNSALTSTEVADLYYSGLGSHSSLAPVATERYTDGEPPVLAWHLNEGYGTTAYDATIYQNSGTISGPTWSADSVILSGSEGSRSLKFDGVDDKISRTYANDPELNPGTSPFSVSTWFKHPSTVTGTDTLASRYSSSGSGGGYKVYMNSSGYICFGVDDDTTWGPDDSACTTVSYADSAWHHVLAIKGTSTIAVYIDGTQKASTAFTVSASLNGSSPTFYVGIDSDGTSNPWDGFIDEVRVYNSVRSEEQINQEYIAKGTNKGVSVILGSGATPESLSNGLVGHWKMDEASWNGTAGEVLDASGNGSHGSAVSSATTGVGKFGNGGTFNGNGQNVNIPVRMINETNPTFSYSFWVKATNTGNSSQDILAQARGGINNNASYEVSYILGSNNICITDGSGSPINCYSKNLSSWTHIGIINDYRNSTYKLFINGELAIRSNTPAGLPIQGLSAQFKIGDHPYSPYNHGFSGSLDDVRIYNRALSPIEVRALYEYAPGPVAHYTFDEGSGQSANDKSGNSNTGTFVSGSAGLPTWSAGKFGKAVTFTGGSNRDRINAGSATILDNLGSKSFTTGMWFKSSILNNYSRLISKENGWHALMNFQNANRIEFTVYCDGGTNATALPSNNPLAQSTDGLWHYLTLKYDNQGDRKTHIYIDGVEVAYSTQTTCTGNTVSDASSDLLIGSLNQDSTTFNGSLDDVRIYNYARTQKQIVSDMNAGHPAVGSPVGSAVAHYKFDEGQGITAQNSGNGGSTLNGTLTNMSAPATSTSGWTNDGKFNKALNFDGSDDYINIPNSSAVDIRTNISISLWVKPTGVYCGSGCAAGIVAKNTAASNGGLSYVVEQSPTGKISLYIDNVGNGFTPQVNTWTLASFTYDGSTVKSYMNGILQTTTAKTGSITSTADPLIIGKRLGGAGRVFNGSVDEVKIYNYALSEDEVKVEFNQGKAIVMGSLGTTTDGKTASNAKARAYCPPGNIEGNCAAGQNPAPVAEWDFSGAAGQSAVDTSGNNNTGQLGSTAGVDASDPTWTNGKTGKGLSFDGSDDRFLASRPTINSTISVCLWAKWRSVGTSTSNIQMLVDNNHSSSPLQGFVIQDRPDLSKHLTWSVNPSSNGAESSSQVGNGLWHYICGTNNGSVSKLYVDGIQDGTANETMATLQPNVSIGYWQFNPGRYLNGLVDQVKIYNYARTPAQIAWDYNKGAPLVQYKFNECSGATINNSVPSANGEESGNNGTLIIGASLPQTSAGTCSSGNTAEAWNNGTTGKLSSSISFDGVDDYARISSRVIPSGDFSISTWFNATNIATSQWLVTQGQLSVGTWLGFIINSSKLKNESLGIAGSTTLLSNTWYHAVLVYSSVDGKEYIYLNGNPDGSGSITPTYTGDNVTIGGNPATTPGGLFAGKIDDVRIYNYALSPVQVRDVYNNGAVSFK